LLIVTVGYISHETPAETGQKMFGNYLFCLWLELLLGLKDASHVRLYDTICMWWFNSLKLNLFRPVLTADVIEIVVLLGCGYCNLPILMTLVSMC